MASLELITDKLDYPSNIVSLKDESKRIFVLEKNSGIIRVIKNGILLPDPFLNIGDRRGKFPKYEQGLVGLAFPPDFPAKKHVYVTYTDSKGHLVLSRFQVTEDNTRGIESSEKVLLTAENWMNSHHCGHMAFGPRDNYLYLCIGDSVNEDSSRKTSQRLDHLQGKILRIDVESPQEPYAIPPDNPFISQKGAHPEIWAYGLRNPWMFSFDSLTGDLFIPDVGWIFWEEINFQPASSKGGENYGWSLSEANECLKSCDDKSLIWPVFEYPHGEMGCAVIGGAIYRGQKFPKWDGVYVFSDFCSGKIWAIQGIKDNPQIRLIMSPSISTTSIATDPNGEILIADGSEGKIYRLIFSENDESKWESIKDVSYKINIDLRRSGLTGKNLDFLRSSRRWRWTQPIVHFVDWIERFFN